MEFLRREVVDLERVIKSLHQTRTDDRYALEQAEALLVRSRDESSMHEGQHELAHHALIEMRTHHTAALGVVFHMKNPIRKPGGGGGAGRIRCAASCAGRNSYREIPYGNYIGAPPAAP